MANKFLIEVSAIDRATTVVRRINQSLAQITAPIKRIRASMRAFSVEMGLDKIGKGLADVGRSAFDVGQRFTAMLTPLSALVGFSSVASVLALSNAWSNLAFSVQRASENSGVAMPRLMALGGAGKLVGIDVETTNASLAQFGTTLQDATFGRNQSARYMLNQLGIGFRRTKDGAVDAARSFEDVARAIANPKVAKNPAVQGLIARTLGLEAMLPLLRQGEAGIKKLIDQVRASGYVMDEAATKQGARFQQSLSLLSLTATGLRNTIGNALIPILGPMVERMTAWVAANRQLIATKVTEVVDSLAKAIGRINWSGVLNGIESFVQSIQKAVDFVGGWQNALIGLVAFMNAPAILAVATLGGKALWLGGLMGGTAIKGVLSFGSALSDSVIGPIAGASTKLGILENGLLKTAGALAGLGAAMAALAVGAGLGTIIAKLTEGTKFNDAIGGYVAKTLAFFGNDEAQEAVAQTDGTKAPQGARGAPAAPSPYQKPSAPAGGATSPSSSAGGGATSAAASGSESTRIDLFIQGLPAGARAMVSGGNVNLRIGNALPTEGTP